MEIEIHDSFVELVQGDITEMDTVAIVNAVSAQPVLGKGVVGAIKRIVFCLSRIIPAKGGSGQQVALHVTQTCG